MREEFIAATHLVVRRIPAGCVLSYKDVSELMDWGSARQVGAVMSASGATLPWWRVIRANGTLPAHLFLRALPHYLEERTALNQEQSRVNILRARWRPSEVELSELEGALAVYEPQMSEPDDEMLI